jgi:hypothetical protein
VCVEREREQAVGDMPVDSRKGSFKSAQTDGHLMDSRSPAG